MIDRFIEFVRDEYQTSQFIPLHEPRFKGNEKKYLEQTIDSTFVSSVGEFVDSFEVGVANFTGAKRAVATVNGTAALHAALHVAGVRAGDYVITQALTFVATCNALLGMGAKPILVDIDRVSLGLCPNALNDFLQESAFVDDAGTCRLKSDSGIIKTVVPMHTFGHPVQLDELLTVCSKWNLTVIEDAAESLGSFYKDKHTGTFGCMAAISFNGNKVITTGGGGMVLCGDSTLGDRVKHVTTTAKVPHSYEFFHDEQGFNYRMPNLNAALGCAQIEQLSNFLLNKRELATRYEGFFEGSEYKFVKEPAYARSNYWLNAVICDSLSARDEFLRESNSKGVMTRPVWQLMNRLPMFKDCVSSNLENAEWAEARLINIPSSVTV